MSELSTSAADPVAVRLAPNKIINADGSSVIEFRAIVMEVSPQDGSAADSSTFTLNPEVYEPLDREANGS